MNKRLLATVVLVLGLVGLSGCAGFQDRAGITHVAADWNQESGKLESLTWTDGKEKQNVTLGVTFPDGAGVTYSARDVRAFEGQEIRGRVAEAIAGVLGDVGPGVLQSLTSAVLEAIGGSP